MNNNLNSEISNNLMNNINNVNYFQSFEQILPMFFMILMGLVMLIYVILDGYDLGIGILLSKKEIRKNHANPMIASIAPFWDANETWLVLGVGILLTCFPSAHGIILGELYLPVAVMLLGLIIRGAAFDFRVKARAAWRNLWDLGFSMGSILATAAQGWMLGAYILGFQKDLPFYLPFCALIAVCVIACYRLLGACWLILKSRDEVQKKAIVWAKQSVIWMGLGIAAISIATPLISPMVLNKWLKNIVLLAPIPIFTMILLLLLYQQLSIMQKIMQKNDALTSFQEGTPFLLVVLILMLAFYGLAYSLFPYIVPFRMDVWQAATSFEALKMIFYGTIIVVPVIMLYTIFSYIIFKGKLTQLYS